MVIMMIVVMTIAGVAGVAGVVVVVARVAGVVVIIARVAMVIAWRPVAVIPRPWLGPQPEQRHQRASQTCKHDLAPREHPILLNAPIP